MWWLLVQLASADPGLMERMAALDARIAAEPCDLDVRATRARLLLRSGWVSAAEDDVSSARACGDDVRLDRVDAEIALHLGDPSRALDLLGGHGDVGSWRLRVEVYEALDRPEDALYARERAVLLDPSATPEALLALGGAWVEVGRPDKAVDLYTWRSARLSKVRAANRAMVDAAIAAGRPQDALDWTEGDDAEQLYLRARIYKAMGMPRWRRTLAVARRQLETWRPSPQKDALHANIEEVM